MAISQDHEHVHPLLGNLIGIRRSSSTVQFRGIPYASIPGRFRQSQLITELPPPCYRATEDGPECPQPPTPYPDYWSPVKNGSTSNQAIYIPAEADEQRCLNLSITAPVTALQGSSRVPVMIWVHGGSFAGGSHTVTVAGVRVYDPSAFVQRSVTIGKPVLVVGINYRTGPLGFLASSKLTALNQAHDEPVGNYGLHDQRRAIDWVVRNIVGFGGDPQQITLYGTSAGAASCHYQVLSDWEKRFQRTIIVSATALGLGPASPEQHEALFDGYVAALGLKADQLDIVALLSELPVQKLLDGSKGLNLGPIYKPLIDGDFIKDAPAQRMSNRVKRGPDMMIGSCAYEKELVEVLYSIVQSPSRMDYLRSSLQPNGMLQDPANFLSPEILKTYKLDSKSSDRSSYVDSNALDLATDIMFRCPPYYTAKNSASRTLLFDFQAVNPYPGARWNYRKAHHGANDLFVFNPAPDLVPAEDRRNWNDTVARVQETWITFCYGELPWKPFDKTIDGPVYLFADSGQSREAQNLVDALGQETASQWATVLAQASCDS